MNLLLDTQVFLWFVTDSPRLSTPARERIAAADSVHVSSASLWEAAIKVGLGKLQADLPELVSAIEASGFLELPVRARHAIRVATLPALHRDPFDRLLVAQAQEEPLHLLTADPQLAAYSPLVVLV